MKNVNNKFATIQINEENKTFTVADLLKEAVNVIPKDGLTSELIQKRLRVMAVVNQAKEENAATLTFEDADFKTAVECVAAMRWAVIDPFIIEFCDLFK